MSYLVRNATSWLFAFEELFSKYGEQQFYCINHQFNSARCVVALKAIDHFLDFSNL